jgi:hypothetical protein
MMLRGSSQAEGSVVDLQTVIEGSSVDSHVKGSEALIRFTDAALSGSNALEDARNGLLGELGEPQLVDTAGVIGNFQRMVRIADSTGIPVDGPMAEFSADIRQQLGLNDLPSARLGT